MFFSVVISWFSTVGIGRQALLAQKGVYWYDEAKIVVDVFSTMAGIRIAVHHDNSSLPLHDQQFD